MKPLNPLKAPLLPLTLSDEASSEEAAPGCFLSLEEGLSLIFCAPPMSEKEERLVKKSNREELERVHDISRSYLARNTALR